MNQRPSDLGQRHWMAVRRGLLKPRQKTLKPRKRTNIIWRKSFRRATPQWKLRQRKQPDWWCYSR